MSSPVEIEWSEPPDNPRALGNTKYGAVAAQLKSRPGEWAKIADFTSPQSARNFAGNLRRGLGVWSPKGHFEAVAREGKVWARYVGDAA